MQGGGICVGSGQRVSKKNQHEDVRHLAAARSAVYTPSRAGGRLGRKRHVGQSPNTRGGSASARRGVGVLAVLLARMTKVSFFFPLMTCDFLEMSVRHSTGGLKATDASRRRTERPPISTRRIYLAVPATGERVARHCSTHRAHSRGSHSAAMLDINLFRTDKGGDPVRAPRRLPGRRARHRRAIAEMAAARASFP